LVPKNPKKSRKNLIFSLFFLWSHPHFCKKLRYHLSFKTRKKSCKKKVEKKVVFIFQNFFFKIDFGHFFMSNFKIKKKVLKTLTFFMFSTIWKMLFIPWKSTFRVFFMKIRILGGTFDNLYFIFLTYFMLCDVLWHFCLFLFYPSIIKYFFIKNVPIIYPSLSKKHLKLSKNCPFGPKKSQKIQKNPEKITFFHFFSYGLECFFVKSCGTI
jgi:hypothetical protein